MISIIVPVYNLQGCIERCIDSIRNQTHKDFELILVNDGSTDDSLKIINKYVLLDSRIKVFDKENGGASSARNFGILKSSGEQICFVDGDDIIVENHLQCLFESFLKNGVDLSISSIVKVDNEGNELTRYSTQENSRQTIEEFLENFCYYDGERQIVASPVNKLYKSSIIKDKKLFFPLGYTRGEDLIFNLNYLRNISSLSLVDADTYLYLDDNLLSQTRKLTLFNIDLQREVLKKKKELLLSFGKYTEKNERILKERYIGFLYFALKNILGGNYDADKEILKKYKKSIYLDKEIKTPLKKIKDKKTKIKLLLLKLKLSFLIKRGK